MLKKTTALALAAIISAGIAGALHAPASAQAKYYDVKQKKWVPMSENPLVKRNMEWRKQVAKQNQMRMDEYRKRWQTKKPANKMAAKPKKQQVAKKTAPKKAEMKKAQGAHKTTQMQNPFSRFWQPRTMQKKQPATASRAILRNSAVERAKPSAKRNSNESPIPAQIVSFETKYAPGTIVIDHSDRRLYHVLSRGTAKAYAVGVGREGFEWTGTNRVSRKAEWPGWTPPPQMIAREKKKGRNLPAYMEGGPNNPLGARAMYLGSSYYRIHGTNQPWSLGKAVSSGCIRMANNDVSELYEQVSVGTKVVVRP